MLIVVWQKPIEYCKAIILQLKREKKSSLCLNSVKAQPHFLSKDSSILDISYDEMSHYSHF